MVKKHKPLRASKTTAEIYGRGVGYRKDYPVTGYSEGGGRVGRAQFYQREGGGRYEERSPIIVLPTRGGTGERINIGQGSRGINIDVGPGGSYKPGFNIVRDMRLLLVAGMFTVLFIISFWIIDGIFEFFLDLGDVFGPEVMTQIANWQTPLTAALGIVACLIVGGVLLLVFFREDEVDDSVYLGGEL